jgi:dTDP-4-dehydrorhamnose 3,5-epimerase
MTDLFEPKQDNQIQNGVFKTQINGMFYIERPYHKDQRGFFSEVVKVPNIESYTGSPFQIKQINHARSEKNVIRGIHAEGWNKFVFIVSGVGFAAIVDVRTESSTFGNKEFFKLGLAEDALSGCLFLPSGIGNSICVLDGPLDYIYVVDKLYEDRDTSGDLAISVFDPDLQIPWPIKREDMIISERDINSITLREKHPEKF